MGQGGTKDKKKGKGDSASAGTGSDSVSVLPPGPLANDGDWVGEIRDEAAWLAYKHEPTDRSFAHVQVVKAIIPVSARVATESEIFFIQSDKWVFHWHFTRDIIKDPGSQDLGDFNALNYSSESRDFVCLTVTRYLDQGLWSFELAARDNFSLENIEKVHALLKSKLYMGDQLAYRPISGLHNTIVASAPTEMPIIQTDKLFSGVKYQPLTVGTTYGFLRRIPEGDAEDEALNKAKWNDILLCEGIPNELPVISGLITNLLQTPLCHVALLCGNRGTPNLAAVGSFSDASVLALIDKPVKLTVQRVGYTLESCTEEEVNQHQAKAFAKLRKGTNITLQGDHSPAGLIHFGAYTKLPGDLQELAKKQIGAKAINCLEIVRKKVGSSVMENSFVIPYYYYYDAIQRIFFQQRSWHWDDKRETMKAPETPFGIIYTSLVEDAKANASPDSKDYAAKCAQIRQIIESYVWEDPDHPRKDDSTCDNHIIPKDGLLADIEATIARWKKSGLWERCDGIILRSSTNAEDIEGFNAAGLYESISISRKDADEDLIGNVLRVLMKVWASVWNFRGFEERRLFGLDSAQVKIAVLCQPLFSSPETQRCNGVAITAHPTRHDFTGQLINVQKAGYLVTDSCGGTQPEQHVVWCYGRQNYVIETLCRSSIMDGKELMSEDELQTFAPILRYLDDAFGHNSPGTSSNIVRGSTKTKFCVDVEFIVLKGSNEIVILQCRPYKMVYEFDLARNQLPKRV